MSGLKEKTWKKWKGSQTTSPVAVTNKKTTDSINSQRSSSLIRSRKRQVPQDVADNILAADSEEIINPRTPVETVDVKRVKTNNKDHFDAEEKNDFRDKSTSPFNTLAPTNPFNRETMMIVQYGEVKENKPLSDMQESNELWGELPSAEVVESPKPVREKGPKGGSKRPTTSKKSKHKSKLLPRASPTDKKSSTPISPQTPTQLQPPTPAQALPDTTSGPSHGPPPPRSGQSQHPRTSPFSDPENGTCDYPECPAHGHGTKQKERLCMAPECPVTLKKAVVKEAKRAMKKSCAKKRKNPLTILGAAFMSTFAGHDSSCKLTKEEKRAMKRMREVEKHDDDGCNKTARPMKSKGVQCKAPILQRSDRARSGPKKADKSTTCDIPECPVTMQKAKIKQFMDKGQLCNIPSCPIKEPPPLPPPPPPRKEKKIEPPRGCPSKPCTLKTKDEEFFNRLDPCIFEKLPRLKMTCEQSLAAENGGQSRPHHTPTGMKNKEKPPGVDRTKDKEVKIVVAPVHVPPPSENPFLQTVPNPQEFSASNKLAGEESKENELNSDRASECKKIVDPWLFSTSGVLSDAKSDKFDSTRSSSPNLREKEMSVIRTRQDGMINGQVAKLRFSNISVEQKDDLRPQSPSSEKIERIGSRSTYLLLKKSTSSRSVKIRFEKSLGSEIEPNQYTVYVVSHQVSQSRLMTSRTLLPSENGLVVRPTQSSCLTTAVKDPAMTAGAVSELQALRGEVTEQSVTFMNLIATTRSNDMEIERSRLFTGVQPGTAKFEDIEKNLPVSKSSSLIGKSDFKIRNTGSLKFDCSQALKNNRPVVEVALVNLFSAVMLVNHSSACSDAISNQILKDPIGLTIPNESNQQIKLHERSWNTSKYSTASLKGRIATSSRIDEKPESPEINDEKFGNHKISDKTTLRYAGKNEQIGNNQTMEDCAFTVSFSHAIPANQVEISTAQSRKLNNLKATCIQTLATSVISPNELNTIGLGTDSIIDLRSDGLASQIIREY